MIYIRGLAQDHIFDKGYKSIVMRKNKRGLLIGIAAMALIFSLYIPNSFKSVDTPSVGENAVESLKWDKKNQLDLPFLESLTRHFLALMH